jgi:hypothetical protein
MAEETPAGGGLSSTTRRLLDAAETLRRGPPFDLDFLHTVLTQTGLPFRNPGEARIWERQQGGAALRIEAGAVADPRAGGFRNVGVPFGEKARLVLIHLTGEALRTGSPVVEVEDSLTAYVRELGLPTDGRTIGTVKEQLARLSAATVRLAYFAEGRAAQVNAALVKGLDLWAPRDPRQRVLWPSMVRLSDDYFASIQSHAVPLARPAIRALAHSALALDAYCWLAQRLHRVPPGKPQAVSWSALREQFGQGFARERDFRRQFQKTLRTVLTVYPDARIDEGEDGLLLHRSRPPVAPRAVPKAIKPATP